MLYPPAASSFDPLFTLSFRYAWRTLRQIFPLIIIFVAIISLLTHLPNAPVFIQWLIGILAIAVAILLLVMAFCQIDAMLREAPQTWRETWDRTLKSILRIYLTWLLLAIVCFVIFFIGKWLVLFLGITGAPGGIAMLLLIGIPMIVLLIFFYLTIPLLALYENSVQAAFYDSAAVARRRFLPLLILYMEIVIMLFISSSHTLHAQWLLNHHLMELCNLLVFSAILPLVLNQTLLLLHDVKLKQSSQKT